VNLVVSLPVDLADEVEDLYKSDPEFIEKVLAYGLVRRAVFTRLKEAAPWHRSAERTKVETSVSSSVEVG
jgi:hypothetical protein